MRALVKAFGTSVANADGSLNRKEMRRLVFSSEGSESRRQILNQITHKYVIDETEKCIEDYDREGKNAVIADVPLMFESGFDKKCDFLVAVIADEEIRINRIVARDNILPEQAKSRINTQIPTDELIRKVDFVIENNGSIEDLRSEVNRLLSMLNL
jgi:dephospho-CoA kinase